jgi:class 3 adenylate cyclase
MQPGRYLGSILLADISGYTRFLEEVQTAHRDDAFADGRIPPAYAMMAGLLEGIAETVEPPFTVLKFEGDAVFAVAADAEMPGGDGIVDCVRHCYADFMGRRAAAGAIWTCTCDACSRSETLDLKFILHHGEFFVQQVGAHTDAVGPEINVAHRLLKNGAVTVLGTTGYALITGEMVTALDISLPDAMGLTETVDSGRVISAQAIALTP